MDTKYQPIPASHRLTPTSHPAQCRMQAADARLAFKTPRDCLRHLFQTEGLRGLARGFSGTLAREIPGNAIYFSTYTVSLSVGLVWEGA